MVDAIRNVFPESSEPTSEVRARRPMGLLEPGAHNEPTLQMPARQRDQMVALSSGDSDEPTLAMRRDRPTNPEGFVLRARMASANDIEAKPPVERPLARKAAGLSDLHWLLIGLACGLSLALSAFAVLRAFGI